MSALMNQARNRVPRLAEAAVERARLTVVPRVRTRAPRVPFVALVSLLLVTGIAGLLLFNTSMQQASFTAAALEQRADALQAREQSLRMALETLRDPQRVAVQARRMGMVPPSSPAFLRLSDGKILGQPAPATAEDAVRVIPLPAPKPANLRPEPLVLPRPKVDRDQPDEAKPDRGDRDGGPADDRTQGNSDRSGGAANAAHGRGSDTKRHQQRGQGGQG